ncbi:MAG: lipocalin family protein [Candidatus Electrothrix sp. Rat3]|nr:lipocalin family protein [Candidatus Electrothrix rattekaaiensis]
MKKLILSIWSLLLTGCLGYPTSVKPVTDFELNKYLGKWYEIARLDHSFERGLEKVSAEYSLSEDGGVKVKNIGFSTKKNKWNEAIGKAFFVRESDEGYLKVSFFGPFYGSYVIFELDKENYQYAFIASSNTSYLWFLSRTPTVSAELKAQFKKRAEELNFNTQELIWVNQE